MKHALTRAAPLKISEDTCRDVIILYKTPYIYTQFNNKVSFIFRKKNYLVDVGFMLRSGFITLHRGERYHLKEYSRNPPRKACELFNLHHASLQNAIERAFGVSKKRFPIVGSSTEPHYGLGLET